RRRLDRRARRALRYPRRADPRRAPLSRHPSVAAAAIPPSAGRCLKDDEGRMLGEVLIEGDGVLAAGGGVAAADEVIGEITLAFAVIGNRRAKLLGIGENESPRAQDLVEICCDGVSFEAVPAPEH